MRSKRVPVRVSRPRCRKDANNAKWKVNANASLPIPCPSCGHKQTVLVSKLRTNPKLTCASCGHVFTIEGSQLDAFMKAIQGFSR